MAAFSAGQSLTAANLIAILPIPVIKGADESVNSSNTGTTLQNDNELLAAVSANTNYKVLLDVIALEAASQVIDIKFAFTMPSGCVLDIAGGGPHTSWNASAGALEVEWAALQNQTSSPTSTLSFGTNTTPFSYKMSGSLRVGGNAGTFQLQWAQVNSNASNLTVKSGSSMVLIPLLT